MSMPDGVVNGDDAQYMLEYLVGQRPRQRVCTTADLKRDGVVTNLDAVLLLAARAGLIPLTWQPHFRQP